MYYVSKLPIPEVSESGSIVSFFPTGLLMVVCFWKGWVFSDFWLWLHILWYFLLGNLWGPIWPSIKGLVSFSQCLVVTINLGLQRLAVVLSDYTRTSILAASSYEGQLVVIISQERYFPSLDAEPKLYQESFVTVSFCTEKWFVIDPNTKGVVFRAPDLWRNLLQKYVQAKMQISIKMLAFLWALKGKGKNYQNFILLMEYPSKEGKTAKRLNI